MRALQHIYLNSDKLVGGGIYREGAKNFSSRIFDSPIAYYLNLENHLQLLGQKLKWTAINFGEEVPSEIKKKIADEALDMVIDWMSENDWMLPPSRRFSKTKGPIHLDYGKLMGLDNYSEGKKHSPLRIFDSREDFLGKLREALVKKGHPVNF